MTGRKLCLIFWFTLLTKVQRVSRKTKLNSICRNSVNLQLYQDSRTPDHIHQISYQDYLSSYRLKAFYSIQKDIVQKDVNNIEKIIAWLFSVPVHEVIIKDMHHEVQKAVSTFLFEVYSKDELKFKFSSDTAYLLRLEWKPLLVERWENRSRNWPFNMDFSRKLNEGYLIAKPSLLERNKINSTMFRYSFAHLERKIVRLQSPTQRLVYLIFKSMIYRWIIPIDSETLSSYIGKTIMFWTCEKYPPHHVLWGDSTKSIIEAVKYLFKQLLNVFEKGYLQYYFVPKINVIANVKKESVKKVKETIRMVLSDIEGSMPKNVEGVSNVLDKARNMLYIHLENSRDFISIQQFFTRGDILDHFLSAIASMTHIID